MLFDFPSEVYVDELLAAPKKAGLGEGWGKLCPKMVGKNPAPFLLLGKT